MIKLLNSTNNEKADQCIGETLSKVLEKYEGIISSYVAGSYANNYAIPTSDIDLYLIFERDLSKELMKEIENYGNKLKSKIDVDLIPRSLSYLKKNGLVGMKNYYLHVWGQSIHHEIPEPNLEDEIYRGMHVGYLRMAHTRKVKPYRYLLEFPTNDSELKGYDWRKISRDGNDQKSIKEIVVLTGWMASGLITWKSKSPVPTKKHCPELFKKTIGGDIADSFEKIMNFCRNKFHYLIPEDKNDYEILLRLLPEVLKIENYFLKEYQDFLIENLKNENPIRVRTSIIRLGEIIYPNKKSLNALYSIEPYDDEHRQKLEQSLTMLNKAIP